jgi:hypothetical protein
MKRISSFGLVDKAKRAYRAKRKRDPSLPDLVPGAGEMRPGPGGSIFVILNTADGGAAAQKFTPRTAWRQRPATSLEIKKLGVTGADEKPAKTLEADLRQATDALLVAAAAVERRAYAASNGLGEVALGAHAPAVPKSNGAGLPHKGDAGVASAAPYNQIAAE